MRTQKSESQLDLIKAHKKLHPEPKEPVGWIYIVSLVVSALALIISVIGALKALRYIP